MSEDRETLQSLKNAVSALGARLAELNRRRGELLIERDRVAALPLARETVLAELESWLAAERAAFLAELTPAAENIANHPAREIPHKARASIIELLGVGFEKGRTAPANIVALLSGPVAVALREVLEAMPWPDESVTRLERAERLGEIDAKLGEVGKELAALQGELAACGIMRPPVIPTADDIREFFKGGILTGPLFDAGMRELHQRLNPSWV